MSHCWCWQFKPKKKDPKKVGGNPHITIVGMIFVLVKFVLEVSFFKITSNDMHKIIKHFNDAQPSTPLLVHPSNLTIFCIVECWWHPFPHLSFFQGKKTSIIFNDDVDQLPSITTISIHTIVFLQPTKCPSQNLILKTLLFYKILNIFTNNIISVLATKLLW